MGHCSDGRVAVLIPCYNEEKTISKVVHDFKIALPSAEIYVYDNNSDDSTADLARSAGANVVFEPRQGKGNVVRQMLRDIDADCYLMVDGDDTYPAEQAMRLIEPILSGRADMVVGDRLSNGAYAKENKRFFHGFGNNLVRMLIKAIYGYQSPDVMSGYRAFSKRFAKTFPVLSDGFQIETELSIHAVDHRCRILSVPVDYRDRPEGSVSKLNTLSDGIRVLVTIAGMFKDRRPLKFFSILSLALVVLGLFVGAPVIVEFFHAGLVLRLPSAILALGLILLGFFALTTGLILDTIAKNNRRQWELEVYKHYLND